MKVSRSFPVFRTSVEVFFLVMTYAYWDFFDTAITLHTSHANYKSTTHWRLTNLWILFVSVRRTPKVTHLSTTQSPRNGMTCWLYCWTMEQTSPARTTPDSTLFTTQLFVEIQGKYPTLNSNNAIFSMWSFCVVQSGAKMELPIIAVCLYRRILRSIFPTDDAFQLSSIIGNCLKTKQRYRKRLA